MTEFNLLPSRKNDHIRINLEQNVQSSLTTGLERYRFIHQALPEVNFEDIQINQNLFKREVRAPILISSMTGGTPEAARINHVLAQAAHETSVAMGLGSQRAGIEHPDLADTFKVRQVAPEILLMANLGAIQLNYGYGIEHCQRAVDMIEADALILHLNPLQEALQPEGDTRFANLLQKIESVCKKLPVPVVIKEVGWGISERVAAQLSSAGVAAIDVAGAGGTSWSQVEMYRVKSPHQARIAEAFRGWGIPTAESILNVRKAAPGLPVFASGGLRDGIDLAKCLALGACMGGMAGLFLKTAMHSVERTIELIEEIQREVKICLFSTGVSTLTGLDSSVLVKADSLQ